jgi:hypothetical protein
MKMSVEVEVNVICEDCGKRIETGKSCFCLPCHTELERKINDLEDEIVGLQEEIKE